MNTVPGTDALAATATYLSAAGWRRRNGENRWDSPDGRSIDFADGGGVAVTVDGHRIVYPAADHRQAVDVLVAYGHLPAELATAYQAGWNEAVRLPDGEVTT